jgi:hypothetical protein
MNTKNRANCREMHDRFLLQLHLEERGGEREREKERGRRRERERERGEREIERRREGRMTKKERGRPFRV